MMLPPSQTTTPGRKKGDQPASPADTRRLRAYVAPPFTAKRCPSATAGEAAASASSASARAVNAALRRRGKRPLVMPTPMVREHLCGSREPVYTAARRRAEPRRTSAGGGAVRAAGLRRAR